MQSHTKPPSPRKPLVLKNAVCTSPGSVAFSTARKTASPLSSPLSRPALSSMPYHYVESFSHPTIHLNPPDVEATRTTINNLLHHNSAYDRSFLASGASAYPCPASIQTIASKGSPCTSESYPSKFLNP